MKKSDFPESFIWGVGSSAGQVHWYLLSSCFKYSFFPSFFGGGLTQVEGASLLDGRTESAWDVFSLLPGFHFFSCFLIKKLSNIIYLRKNC